MGIANAMAGTYCNRRNGSICICALPLSAEVQHFSKRNRDKEQILKNLAQVFSDFFRADRCCWQIAIRDRPPMTDAASTLQAAPSAP